MATHLEISGALKRTQKGNADWYYGGGEEAWPNILTAKAGVPAAIRPGKTIGIFTAGEIVEYWWPSTAVADTDLVLKAPTIIADTTPTQGSTNAVQSGAVADALSAKANKLIAFNDISTAYTLQLSDADKKTRVNSSAAVSLTLPSTASAAFTVGSKLSIRNIGAGNVNLIADVGVTIRGSLEIAQYNEAQITLEALNTWSATMVLADTTAISSKDVTLKRNPVTHKLSWQNTVLEQGGRGNALKFVTGSNQYFTGSDAGLPTGNPTALSVAGWVYNSPSSYGAGNLNTLLAYGDLSTGHGLAVICATSTGSVFIQSSIASAPDALFFGTGLPLNSWNHVVITFSSSTVNCYVNKNLIATGLKTFNIVLNGDLNNKPFGYYSSGYIQQLLVYNSVLESDDIVALYADGGGVAIPILSNTVRYFPFQEGTDSTIRDYNTSGTTYNLTTYNNPVWLGVGNGIAPTTGINAPTTIVESYDGIYSNERGQVRFGDFLSGTYLRGITLKGLVNNLVVWCVSNIGNFLIAPNNSSEVAVSQSSLGVQGNAAIGTSYATANAAPANGLAIEGTTLIGTATDNQTDILQVAGSALFTGTLKFPTTANSPVGTAQLTAGTVTVSNNKVNTGSSILLSRHAPGGTMGNIYVSTITAGSSFVICSDNTADTSSINYLIIN